MIAINVNATITQKRPAIATVVNFGVSFLHLNVTENIEKPIEDRKSIDKDLDEYQKDLWNIMYDEARAADVELLNV